MGLARVKPLSRAKQSKVPFPFVLDALAVLSPEIRPMFGCLALYVDDRLVLVLRDKSNQNNNKHPEDNGVWVVTSKEHHESLQREFPRMRSIKALGTSTTSWQVLPMSAPDFEESVPHACDLILKKDVRIGKVPKSRQR